MSAADAAIEAILFDKDGTLIDFNASWIGAGLIAARQLCTFAQQPERCAALLAGAGYDAGSQRLDPHSLWAAGTTESLVRHWTEELAVPGSDREALVSRTVELMSLEATRRIVPLADLAALFVRLRARGLRLGVATMDLEANAHTALRRLGASESVDFVCGCDSGHGVKPGPGMVLAFCRSCSLEPHQVMVVGDTPHDMNMARAAGAGARVAVTSGAARMAELLPLADHVLDDLDGLEDLLDKPSGDTTWPFASRAPGDGFVEP